MREAGDDNPGAAGFRLGHPVTVMLGLIDERQFNRAAKV